MEVYARAYHITCINIYNIYIVCVHVCACMQYIHGTHVDTVYLNTPVIILRLLLSFKQL